MPPLRKMSTLKSTLASSYDKLGETYILLGQLDSALIFLKEHTGLSKELYEASPQNVNFKIDLASSYDKLGETYTSLGQLDSALINYEQFAFLKQEAVCRRSPKCHH